MDEDVDWHAYFKSIKQQCPWSWQAYQQHAIDIVPWKETVIPLTDHEARIYVCDMPERRLEKLADSLDQNSTSDEWLFSYPGYGPWATPVAVLIQQNRSRLNELRDIINS